MNLTELGLIRMEKEARSNAGLEIVFNLKERG